MRAFGSLHPTDQIPVEADTVQTLLIANSSGQAMDWPTGTAMVRLTGTTTAGAALNYVVNLASTYAAIPSSGLTTGSSAANHMVNGTATYQLIGGSTGWSVASLSSGYVSAECWRK